MASEVKTRKRKLATVALVAAGVAVLAVSIIKPLLDHTRMTSGRVPCASNLRQVGQALLLYAIDNGRVYPPKLETMRLTIDMSPDVLRCADGDDDDTFVFLVPHGRMDDYGFDDPIVYEPASYHDGLGGNVLFGDGHVAFVERAMLDALLARAATRPSNAMGPASVPAP